MHNYLEATNGQFRASAVTPEHKAAAVFMLSHENPGERPFAIAKYLAHLYPNMTLDNKSKVAHAMANKTFRRQESPVKQKVSSRQVAPTRAGIAFTAP
jgi:hypothetical protein